MGKERNGIDLLVQHDELALGMPSLIVVVDVQGWQNVSDWFEKSLKNSTLFTLRVSI